MADDKNADTVTPFEGVTYGLYSKNQNGETIEIYVGDNVCQYQTSPYMETGGMRGMNGSSSFQMPESSVIVYPHKWQTDGKCSNASCLMVDIERAYKSKALTIEGLEGRTYDSYPQILSKITWKSENGTVKELLAPIYDKNGFSKPLLL